MYSAISQNKRRTWALMIIMSALVLGLSSLAAYSFGADGNGAIILGTMFTTGYALVSYYWSDKIALSSSGAKPITKQDAPDLYNLVENLCIAQGQPVPAIYIINDASPNAFATGRDPKHASIAFTTGILDLLDKKELEGVAAHELSHVKNYDTRVMTIVVVLVGAIMLVSDMLLHARFFGGGRRDNNGNSGAILLVIGLVLAILSPLFAQIIQLAVSRQREFLADASGAMLTRYPEGLASALEKISSASAQRPLAKANHATAHLYIENPFGEQKRKRGFFSSLFSTHPPVEERVARLRSMGG